MTVVLLFVGYCGVNVIIALHANCGVNVIIALLAVLQRHGVIWQSCFSSMSGQLLWSLMTVAPLCVGY